MEPAQGLLDRQLQEVERGLIGRQPALRIGLQLVTADGQPDVPLGGVVVVGLSPDLIEGDHEQQLPQVLPGGDLVGPRSGLLKEGPEDGLDNVVGVESCRQTATDALAGQGAEAASVAKIQRRGGIGLPGLKTPQQRPVGRRRGRDRGRSLVVHRRSPTR
jgi:hypothetical protein